MIGDGLTVMSTEDDATTPTASTIVSVMVKLPALLNVKVFPDYHRHRQQRYLYQHDCQRDPALYIHLVISISTGYKAIWEYFHIQQYGEFTLMVRLSLVVEPNLSTTFIVTENVPVPLNVITLSM